MFYVIICLVSIEVKVMANIKSAKKDIKSNATNRLRNISYKSKLRTAIKNVKLAIESKDLEKANKALVLAVSVIDKSVTKGIQKHATAARQKSHLQTAVNSLKTAE